MSNAKHINVPIMANELRPSLSLDFVPFSVSAAEAAASAAALVKVELPDTKVVSASEGAGVSVGSAISVCTSVVWLATEVSVTCSNGTQGETYRLLLRKRRPLKLLVW